MIEDVTSNITDNTKFSVIKQCFSRAASRCLFVSILFFYVEATISNSVLSEMSVKLQILGKFFKYIILFTN